MGEAWSKRRIAMPAVVFLICAGAYVATLGARVTQTSPDPHFVHLADSYLHGQLSIVGNKPPGTNDWARYEGRWYVSFPPLPALVILPAVAIWGTHVWDRLFWAILAGFAPALLFVLLRALRERGQSPRTVSEDLMLTGLFAFGSVYFFSAVQGTVWFAAHVLASSLTALFLLCSLGGNRPLLAGSMLALCFVTRPSTLWLGAFFVAEAMSASRTPTDGPFGGVRAWLSTVDFRAVARRAGLFAIPMLAVGLLVMWLNVTRFDDPLEFGHSYLEIKWRKRTDTWGLFNYHFLSRNLAVAFASLPWLSAEAPYLKIGRHGVALWVTTPHLLWLLWPRRLSPTMIGLMVGAAAVAVMDLLYHNSGWVQFGYRFSLDYMMALMVLLALGARPFGWWFRGLMVWALVANLFGAITFDRVNRFYDNDASQRRIFQPD